MPVRIRGLMWTARLSMDERVSGDQTASSAILAQLEQALTLARSIHDEQLELEALVFQTSILTPDADLTHTLAVAEDGIALAQRSNRWKLAELSHTASLLAHWTGDHERAADLAADACALADELGNERLSIEARLTLSFTTPGTRARSGEVHPMARAKLYLDEVPAAGRCHGHRHFARCVVTDRAPKRWVRRTCDHRLGVAASLACTAR